MLQTDVVGFLISFPDSNMQLLVSLARMKSHLIGKRDFMTVLFEIKRKWMPQFVILKIMCRIGNKRNIVEPSQCGGSKMEHDTIMPSLWPSQCGGSTMCRNVTVLQRDTIHPCWICGRHCDIPIFLWDMVIEPSRCGGSTFFIWK
jgi:hypothetical protein